VEILLHCVPTPEEVEQLRENQDQLDKLAVFFHFFSFHFISFLFFSFLFFSFLFFSFFLVALIGTALGRGSFYVYVIRG